MIKFLRILSRYEAAEFSQVEAAELVGEGQADVPPRAASTRTMAMPGFSTGGWARPSGKRVPVDREAEVEALYRTCYTSGIDLGLIPAIDLGLIPAIDL
jgi:hypothetical protein